LYSDTKHLTVTPANQIFKYDHYPGNDFKIGNLVTEIGEGLGRIVGRDDLWELTCTSQRRDWPLRRSLRLRLPPAWNVFGLSRVNEEKSPQYALLLISLASHLSLERQLTNW